MVTACLPLRNIAPVSASAADVVTVQIVWHFVRIGLFELGVGQMGGGGGVSFR